MGWVGIGQLATVVAGVWGGMSLSRVRDVATSGSCQRDQPSMSYIRVASVQDTFLPLITFLDKFFESKTNG